MSVTAVVTAASAEAADRAVAALVLAFATDPATRWTWPDPRVYLAHFPSFVRAFGGKAFAHGTADLLANGTGAALWLPPDVHPDDEALDAVLQPSVAPAVLAQAGKLFERMAAYHPAEPHWYLPLVGVDPAHQGKGVGSALLRHALARCDREGKAAYLESTNRTNIPLYERHGFVVRGEIQVGSSPTLFPMFRAARATTR
jgi:GNAT superfamily N-acetyltransferase